MGGIDDEKMNPEVGMFNISARLIDTLDLPAVKFENGNSKTPSPNGKVLTMPVEKDICLVDLEYAKVPYEQARRKHSASVKVAWHRAQAETAESVTDWYCATFHRVWVVKAKPDSETDLDALKRDYSKLQTTEPNIAKHLTHLVPEDFP